MGTSAPSARRRIADGRDPLRSATSLDPLSWRLASAALGRGSGAGAGAASARVSGEPEAGPRSRGAFLGLGAEPDISDRLRASALGFGRLFSAAWFWGPRKLAPPAAATLPRICAFPKPLPGRTPSRCRSAASEPEPGAFTNQGWVGYLALSLSGASSISSSSNCPWSITKVPGVELSIMSAKCAPKRRSSGLYS